MARHSARSRRGRPLLPITLAAALMAIASIVGATLLISISRQPPRPATARSLLPITEPAAATTAAAPSAKTAAAATGRLAVDVGELPLASRAGDSFEITGTLTAPAGTPSSSMATVTVESAPGDLDGAASSWRPVRAQAVAAGVASTAFAITVTPTERGVWAYRVRAAGGSGHGVSRVRRVNVVGTHVVALTFDDGPSATTTPRVLEALDAAGIHATFFLSGRLANRHPQLARRLIAEGEVVGCHGATHTLLTPLTGAKLTTEVAGCRDTLERITGVRPTWFRPPLGGTNPAVRGAIADAGMRQVMWSVDPQDWKSRNTALIVEAVLSHVKDGSVVLMHDSGGQDGSTDEAVPILIRELSARGYDFVTLDELAALGYTPR